MKTPQEIELKLDVPPAAGAALARSPALDGHAPPRRRQIVSVYFDTADFALRKSGFTLRVRRDGRRRLQTVKGSGSGLLGRDEWEQPIRGDGPDLEAARATGLKPVLSRKLSRRLKPLFETAIWRTTYALHQGDSEIDLTFDEGQVAAGSKTQAFQEIELELRRGTAADLFELARRLNRDLPVHLSLRSKSERGYALVEGKRAAPVKAQKVTLTPDLDAGAALQAIARSCLRQLVANHPLIRAGNPEALHQTRIAVRRLRTAFSLFAAILTDPQSREMKAQLRWLSGELNPARELDVFIARVVKPMAERRRDEIGLAALLKDLRRRRAEAYRGVHSALESFRFRDLVLGLAAWTEAGDWTRNADPFVQALRRRPVAEAAAEELQRRRGTIRKRGRQLRQLSPARRHKLRIQAKKVRYASEFFADVYPGRGARKRRAAFVAALEAVQDALGELNDIAVHEDLSAGLVHENGGGNNARSTRPRKAFAAGRLAGYEQARIASVMAHAERAIRAFAGAKPFW